MANQSLQCPDGYSERVRLALESLPGSNAEKGRRLGVHYTQIGRWVNGSGHCSNPVPLADAVNVHPGVLVYGPTAALRVQLHLPPDAS